MPPEPRALSIRHREYLAQRTRGEDEFLVTLKRAAQDAGIPPIWISPEQASFMRILLRLAGAREVVEVGTLAGYSAIQMARALPPGGRVRTVELSPAHADFAEAWIARSDVADRVEVLRGAGSDVLPALEAGATDAVFLDADKSSYELYLREALRLLRPGGLVMVDNAFAFGRLFDDEAEDESVSAIRAFNDHLAGHDELESVIVPLGDGCWVGVKA